MANITESTAIYGIESIRHIKNLHALSFEEGLSRQPKPVITEDNLKKYSEAVR